MGWGYWLEARRGEIFPNRYESTTRKQKEGERERENSIHSSNSSYECDVSFGDGSIPSGIKAWTDSTAIPFLTFELIWPLIGGKNYFRYCCIIGDTIDRVEGIFVSSET